MKHLRPNAHPNRDAGYIVRSGIRPDPHPRPAYNFVNILCWAGILAAVAYFAFQIARAVIAP
jgi:hypothetical protein